MKYAIPLLGRRPNAIIVDSRDLPSLRRHLGNLDKLRVVHEAHHIPRMRYYKVTLLHKGGHSVREATSLREIILCNSFAMKRFKHRTECYMRERNKREALKEASLRMTLRTKRASSNL